MIDPGILCRILAILDDSDLGARSTQIVDSVSGIVAKQSVEQSLALLGSGGHDGLFSQELFTPNDRSSMALKSMFYIEEAVPVRPDDAVRTQRALAAALRSLSDSTFV
ncbi:MAG: hypothetical protein ITG02_07090, partial [Patulibacter sp.]|nr:hypothetical protein [Patulibacter sp.]